MPLLQYDHCTADGYLMSVICVLLLFFYRIYSHIRHIAGSCYQNETVTANKQITVNEEGCIVVYCCVCD